MTDGPAWVAGVVPPGLDDGPDGPARWWLVQGSSVLVAVDGGPPTAAPTGHDREPLYLGALDGEPQWALDVDGLELGEDHDHLRPTDLFSLHPMLGEVGWAVAGRAVQLVEWARTHRFCGRCGTGTEPVDGERARRCPACGLLAFPRLAPAMIVLVERGHEVLLARGTAFPVPMYSCLAGFVEPGESVEEAVVREVREEVGLEVGDVRYQSSQPWPFPHSLMLGFRATYRSGVITPDPAEIVDAGWYTADDLPMVPPGISIARKLIDAWAAEQA